MFFYTTYDSTMITSKSDSKKYSNPVAYRKIVIIVEKKKR